jgi:hypothetical protein
MGVIGRITNGEPSEKNNDGASSGSSRIVDGGASASGGASGIV